MLVVATFALNSVCNFAVGLLVAKFLGPEEFGRFALALAIATFLNGAAFDWIRLAATRFYAARTRREAPEVRATLEAAFAMIVTLVGLATMGLLLSGIHLQLSSPLVGVSIASGVATALYDYHTALLRARFLDRSYSRLVIVKNTLSVGLTLGGAWVFHSAACALVGLCLSVAGALMTASSSVGDPEARPRRSSLRLMRSYAVYGMPIVATMVLYHFVALTNRTLVASWHGFAETGQFSLAFDIGWRIFATIGSSLDVLLFQIAVRFDDTHGPHRARQQVAHNMSVVFAILLPTCVGTWLVLPSFEAIVVPEAFRGPFAHYLALLLPGLFSFALGQYAINPSFQIVKRTVPLIAAALVGCLMNGVLIVLLPRGVDGSNLALAQSASLVTGLLVLIVIAALSNAVWPAARDILLSIAASGIMAGCLLPLRHWHPGAAMLVLQAASGVAIVGTVVLAFDVAGLRSQVLEQVRSRMPLREEVS